LDTETAELGARYGSALYKIAGIDRHMTTPRKARERAPVRHTDNYVLIAMPSVNRAAAVRAAITAGSFEIVVVRDGEEARQQIVRRGAPVLLILDLSLPKIDGFELLRELRQHATPGEAGAIVVSGHSAVRAAAKRLAEPLGISRVLSLDVDRNALRDAIEATLNELNAGRGAVAPVTTPVEERVTTAAGVEEIIDSVVIAAARRFRTAITVVYVRLGQQEYVRGWFALGEADGAVNAAQSLTFLRQVAAGNDTLIVPNVTNHPAVDEIAPGGMAFVRGFAAVPITAPRDISGALCVLDTKPLQMDATELDAFEALGRDLVRDLGAQGAAQVSAKVTPVDIDSLERLASADPLTGLANRRGGEKDIAAEISRARRQNTALSCVLLDIDHFKEVNDTFGHQAGDYVLREISALLRRTVRAYDILVRWGGEEFLVVLPGVEHEQALKLAERIRHAVENMPLAGIGGITASVGVAVLGNDYSFDAMFAAADRRLYSAKASGRNTVA
jgi:diguanylate cyclase (GGDEF)-like protein